MNMETEALLLLLLLRRRRRRRLMTKSAMNLKKRKIWMNPNLVCEQEGDFYTLYPQLRKDEEAFFNYFRMSITAFDELSNMLKESISRKDTTMRKSVPAEERIAITLRYLCSGCTFEDLHLSYRRGVSTINGIVKEVCIAIWNNMKDTYLGDVTEQNWKEIAHGFKSRAQFPNCLGAIAGKHVRITKPERGGSVCVKHFFSIILLGMCNSDYKFTYIDVGGNERNSDTILFEETELYEKLQSDKLNIPSPMPISTNGDALPYVIVGNEAFALSENLLRPYIGSNLPEKKRIFNYRLSRARKFIECTFAILTSKWQIFHEPFNVSADFARDIAKACCILHNFVLERDGYSFDDTLIIHGVEDEERVHQDEPLPSADLVRDQFASYFMSDEGSVPWQQNSIKLLT